MLTRMADLIGSREAARILNIDRSVLVKRVQAGKVQPRLKLESATGAYLFDREYIERLAAERAS